MLDGDNSAGVPDGSLKQIAKDDNDAEICKDSYNDEGQKTDNDDSGVMVSKPNIGENDEGDGCFNESITKVDKSFLTDKESDAEPATVVLEKECVDEKKS